MIKPTAVQSTGPEKMYGTRGGGLLITRLQSADAPRALYLCPGGAGFVPRFIVRWIRPPKKRPAYRATVRLSGAEPERTVRLFLGSSRVLYHRLHRTSAQL